MKAPVAFGLVAVAICVAVSYDDSAAVSVTSVSLVSVATDEIQANGRSLGPSISDDGRWVAFSSLASNLVPDDTNGVFDVFVRDRLLGTTVRVSVSSAGEQGNAWSLDPQISGNGQLVAFYSEASNLVDADVAQCLEHSPSCPDVFVHDLVTGITELVSISTTGIQADGPSNWPSISDDGQLIAFVSAATNLVTGDTNSCPSSGQPSCPDIFLRDRVAGTTTRVSVGPGGEEAEEGSTGVAISGDGSTLAYSTASAALIGAGAPICGTRPCSQVIVYDRQTSSNVVASRGQDGNIGTNYSASQVLSDDGRHVAFLTAADGLVDSDTNGLPDVYLRDLEEKSTERISLSSSEVGTTDTNCPALYASPPACISMSNDGRLVAFEYRGTDLVDDPNTCLGGPNSFRCFHIYVRDRALGTTVRVSVNESGTQGDGSSDSPAMNGDGTVVAFKSAATNLVAGDMNLCQADQDPDMDPCPDVFAAEGMVPPVPTASPTEATAESPSVSPTESPSITPITTPTATPTRSGSPTAPVATVTPPPAATPTPTQSVAPAMTWGDTDCDLSITSRDNQGLLRVVLQQNRLSQTEPCPDIGVGNDNQVWGDWDCDGAISTRDNQALLREVLGQAPLSQESGCPDLGSEIVLT